MAEKIEVVVRWPWETSNEFQQLAIDLLRQIMATIQRTEGKENEMAETLESMNAKLDSIGNSLQNVVGDIGQLQTEIKELKDKLAAGTVTQADLDAFGAKLAGVEAAAQAAADIVKPE